MSLIEFELREIERISPWGLEPSQYLNWFGLSDGIYYIDVGKDKLFRYSDEIIKYWSEENPNYHMKNMIHGNFMSYQIASFHEEILELLPEIIQPVPYSVGEYISTIEKQREWRGKMPLTDVADEQEMEVALNAVDWFNIRSINGFPNGPTITFWRVDDIIRIRWDNLLFRQSGLPIWAACAGECALNIKDFLDEIESFHSRFMGCMDKRIDTIATSDLYRNNSLFDTQRLQEEQQERILSLDAALNEDPYIEDWGSVISAMQLLAKG